MKKNPAFIGTVTGIAAIALLSACSATPGSAPSLTGTALSQSHSLYDLARSGVSPKFFGLARPHRAGDEVSPAGGGADLFVSDAEKNAVDLLANKHWTYVTDITDGIGGPDGNWIAGGEFYVANYEDVSITEYNSATSVKYTYSSGMIDPIDVTADKHGNVYEADYNYPGDLAGFVNEYAQQSNNVTNTCGTEGGVEGVAVDKHGNVFADYNETSGSGAIVEFKGGLAKCAGTVLPISLEFAGGMALDEHGNLLVCDQNAKTVDIIKPPYNSVSGTLGSGFSDPFHVTINKKNTQAYVADYATGEVYVLSYPSGKTISTLGTANGISFAWAAVDGNNYVP
jgi:hypothetical protein